MNKSVLVAISTVVSLCALAPVSGLAQQDIDSMPPVVVKTVPEAGATAVSPGTVEIKVTFSKEMADGSWSWIEPWKGANGTVLGKPKYESDQKTCVLKVKVEPNKTYAFWLNRGQFQNFKDQKGHSAVPYLLSFQTKGN
jgi:RNA polymerase sigma-70 factor (ECF subfamily)